MPRIVIPFVLTFLLCGRIAAQPLSVDPQHLAIFPGSVSNLSLLDGEMYAYSEGLFLHLPRITGSVTAAVGDTLWGVLDKDVSYIVRNPRTGNIFFQTTTKSGSTLYEQVPREGKSPKITKIKLPDAKGITIEHPVFTEDGMIMIFSTANRIGFGGSDLWYSEYDTLEQQWQRPVNMGDRINTQGDESSPAIADGFLLFTSRNRQPGDSVWSLYAARFKSETASVDTARRNTIGLASIQKLPTPINSSADDYEVVADPKSHALYWLSRRKGTDALFLCRDALQFARLHGRVTTKGGTPLPYAIVDWTDENGSRIATVPDAEGYYQLLIKVGVNGSLNCWSGNCFCQEDQIAVMKGKEFFADITHNVMLDTMPVNTPIRYENIFASASADFTPDGLEQMKHLAEFLDQNPHLSVSVSLSSAAFGDMLLDKMLSDSRIEALKSMLNVKEDHISCTNSTFAQSQRSDAKESEIVVEMSLHYSDK